MCKVKEAVENRFWFLQFNHTINVMFLKAFTRKEISWKDRFWRINVASLLAFLGLVGAFHPTLSLYALELNASPLLLGILFTWPRLLGMVIRFPASAFSSIIGRKPLLLFGGAVCVIAPLLLSQCTSMAAFIAIASIYGLTNVYGPVAISLVHDVVPEKRKTTYMAYYSTTSAIGSGLGPLMAGILLDVFHSYELVFYACALCGLLSLLLTASIPYLPPANRPTEPLRTQLERDLKTVASNTNILFVCGVRTIQNLLVAVVVAFFPWYGKKIADLSASQIGIILGLITLGSVMARAFASAYQTRTKRNKILVVTTVLNAFLIYLFTRFTSFEVLFILALLVGMIEGISVIAGIHAMSDFCGMNNFGAGIGLMWALGDFGIALGRFLPGVFLPADPTPADFRAVFLGLSIFCLVATYFIGMKRFKRFFYRRKISQ